MSRSDSSGHWQFLANILGAKPKDDPREPAKETELPASSSSAAESVTPTAPNAGRPAEPAIRDSEPDHAEGPTEPTAVEPPVAAKRPAPRKSHWDFLARSLGLDVTAEPEPEPEVAEAETMSAMEADVAAAGPES